MNLEQPSSWLAQLLGRCLWSPCTALAAMIFHINHVFNDHKSILVYRILAHPPHRALLLRFIWIDAHILPEALYAVYTESSTLFHMMSPLLSCYLAGSTNMSISLCFSSTVMFFHGEQAWLDCSFRSSKFSQGGANITHLNDLFCLMID